MRTGVVRGLDLAPLLGASIAALMVVLYVRVVAGQDGETLPWVIGLLAVGGLGCGYGVSMSAPHRRLVLAGAAAVLGVLGLLAILSIGLPILAAAGLALIGMIRPAVVDAELG